MPYSGPGDRTLPDNIKGLPERKRAQWVAVFNSAFSRCQDGDGDDCEAAAFRQANGVVFSEADTFTPPQAAQRNARRVLSWKKEHGDAVRGMTQVGWARARQLASGDPVSSDVVKRMAQFERHRQNAEVAPEHKDEPWRDAGYVAWLGWGGDEGIDWAKRTSAKLTASECLAEAVTLKSQAQRLMRDITAILKDKAMPATLRKEIEDVRAALRKTWSDLEAQADGEGIMGAEMEWFGEADRVLLSEFIGSPRNPYGTHASAGYPGGKTAWKKAWRVYLSGQQTGPIQGTIRRIAMIAKNMKPVCSIPQMSAEDVGPRSGAAGKLAGTWKGKPGDYNLSSWKSPSDDDKQQEDIQLTCQDLIDLKRICLQEIRKRQMEREQSESAEMADEAVPYLRMGPRSFADLHAAQKAKESASRVWMLTDQYSDLIRNVLNDPVGDKVTALETLSAEFLALVGEALSGAEAEEAQTPERPSDSDAIELSESATGHAIKLVENANGANRRAPLDLDIVIIRPGFGNKRDNHYYGRGMLEQHAGAFVGAKMYSTNHRENEKSVRTEVSRIKEIVGFNEGAPVARVSVFDPDFAELVRNRSDANELKSLECSILANGMARKGTVNGKEAKIVESITSVRSVDWVTSAGAGGHALRLAEGSEGIMNENEREQPVEQAELEEVTIHEGEDGKKQVNPEPPAPQGETENAAQAEAATPEPQALSEAAVEVFIPDGLPQPARARVLSGQYFTEDEAKQAITAEVEYLRALGSGKPFGKSPRQPALTKETLEERNKRLDAVNARWLG